jgi:hypothetical protein
VTDRSATPRPWQATPAPHSRRRPRSRWVGRRRS